jgi:hypothetical protein
MLTQGISVMESEDGFSIEGIRLRTSGIMPNMKIFYACFFGSISHLPRRNPE